MRRFAVIVSVVAALFLSTTSVWAQEEALAYKHLKDLKFLLGNWDLTGEIHWAGQQPEPFTYQRQFRWTMDRSFIQTTITEAKNDRREIRHKSMIEWDAKAEGIKETGFWNMENPTGISTMSEVVTWSKDGKQWLIRADNLEGVYTIIDRDTHKYEAKFRGDDGSENSWHFTAKRRKKATAANAKESFAYLQGEWTTEWSNGDVLQAKWDLLENGLGLIGRFVDNDGYEGMEIAVWRPKQKAIVVTGCGTAGNYYQLKYTDLREDSSHGTIFGMLPDGMAIQGNFTLKRTDDNHFEFGFHGTGNGNDFEFVGKCTRKL
jgi:hypothetical protein